MHRYVSLMGVIHTYYVCPPNSSLTVDTATCKAVFEGVEDMMSVQTSR